MPCDRLIGGVGLGSADSDENGLTAAIWRHIYGHMTIPPKAIQDIVLIPWKQATQGHARRPAFRRKVSWVVDAPRSSALWYTIVLSNLTSRPVRLKGATIDAVRAVLSDGLSRTAFDRLKLITDVSSEELTRVIKIAPRTLSRRDKFKPEESERILRVASAFQKALEVLGGLERARRWFIAPKRALGGKTPLAFCDTEPGAEEVEHLLGRIEHGVFT
jgi:putative toxin-antitoxin system antitoxin component (TIGR02293 family)